MSTREHEARLAENEAIFRDANEAIETRAEELDFTARVPFLCECGDPGCREIIRVSRDEYAEVRSNRRRFLITPAHAGVATAAGRVVAERERYLVVEKEGVAGRVAERGAAAPSE